MSKLSTKCRGLLEVAAVCTAVAAFGTSTPALADDPSTNGKFELDGNTVDNSPSGLPDDWNDFHVGSTSTSGTGARATTGIVLDTAPKVFTQGSKDTLDIPNWAWRAGSSPSKADLQAAYAAAYDSNGHLIVYFGSDRLSTSGTVNSGFWFFKNQITTNANGTFNGAHAEGDVLVAVAYDNGGHVGDIEIYKWESGKLVRKNGATNNSLSAGLFCDLAVSGVNTVCGITNGGSISIPWRSPTTVPAGAFFEGGVDITALFPEGGSCFSSFMATTRSSTTANAEIKNFVLNSFPVCDYAVTKSCTAGSIQTDGSVAYTVSGNIESTGPLTINSVTDNPATDQTITTQSITCPSSPDQQLVANPTVCYSYTGTITRTQADGSFNDTITVDATFAGDTSSTIRTAQATCPSVGGSASLVVEKSCTVELVNESNRLVVKVNIDGTVTNPATSQLNVNSITVSDNPTATLLDDSSQPLGTFNLAPGASKHFTGTYYPTAGSPLPGTNECAFTDQLTAGGTDSLGTAVGPTMSDVVQCKLCPQPGTCVQPQQ